jgi:hypothetical protein
MELPPGTPSIWQQLQSFQQFMGEFQTTIKDPASKELFGDLLNQLKKASAEAQQVVPGVVQDLKASAEQTKAEAEAMQKEFERLQQELERAKEQAAKPAAAMAAGRPPEPAIQANLGKQYTAELLQVFGPTPIPATPAEQADSLWRHVDQMPKTNPEPTPIAGSPPPKDRPKPLPADQAGESSLWRVLDDPDKPAKPGG